MEYLKSFTAGFGRGFLEGSSRLGTLTVWALAIWAFVHFSPATPFDATDAAPERSGMRLHTDAQTGCQYLSRWGGLTPRLNASGAQICGVRP